MSKPEPNWDRYMNKLQLTQELDTEHYQAFRMAKPGTRCGSMRIVFTPEGIVILGDLTPMYNGVISNLGYGLGWFSGQLSGSYLCEKFLREEFVPECALSYLKESLECSDDYGWTAEGVEAAKELKYRLENQDLSGFEFYEALQEFDPDGATDGVGHGYNRRDAGMLCAIQRRFSVLRAAQRVKEHVHANYRAMGKSKTFRYETLVENVAGYAERVRAALTLLIEEGLFDEKWRITCPEGDTWTAPGPPESINTCPRCFNSFPSEEYGWKHLLSISKTWRTELEKATSEKDTTSEESPDPGK